MTHPTPADESARLAALRRYGILDTPAEQAFDDLVNVAALVCDAPIAIVSLVDECRQWFKAVVGIEATETPREVAFCDHTIRRPDDVLIVTDATTDPRFRDNPFVAGAPHIRFYAGAPLVTPDGHALGTLCVVDYRPRELTAAQLAALTALARQVVAQLELRRRVAELRASEDRFRAFMDHSPSLAWMKDEQGRYAYLSRRYEERFGIRFADWEGKTDADVWPAEVADGFQRNDRAVLASGQPVEAIEPDDAAGRWLVLKFPFADADGRRYVGGVGVDVSERERVQDELVKTNADLRAALDKVNRLEKSLVTMCAWTRTMNLDGRWVPVEEFLRERFGVRVSHGMSDDVLRRMEEDALATD